MVRSGLEVELSVVVPAHNEQDNVRPLVEEIVRALEPLDFRYEIIIVDDGSTDATPGRLRELSKAASSLRVVRLEPDSKGKGRGQSAAFRAGFLASLGRLIVTLDADLQNYPGDIPRLVKLLHTSGADMVQGDRSAARRDGIVKRFSSRVGRLFRRWLLGDSIRDTGCSLRVMKREVALALPLEFRGMHRFIPVTARQLGFRVVETPVNHRPRTRGKTNYGIWNRALPGLVDCLAVRWMHKRRISADALEVLPSKPYADPSPAVRESSAEVVQR